MSTRRHHRVAAIDRFQIGDFKDNTSRSVKRRLPKMEKYVYFFGDGHADGNGDMKDILGGKGAGLAEMTNAGLPVPPGFTIAKTATRCRRPLRVSTRRLSRSSNAWLEIASAIQAVRCLSPSAPAPSF